MLVNFNILPDNSRIWIYASEYALTKKQKDYILSSINFHLTSWESHKSTLTAGVKILENHFIIVALDENLNYASGCSIDSLHEIIQKIERKLSISLMNRLNVFCKVNKRIECIPSFRLIDRVNKDTLFFDLTVKYKRDLAFWLKPIKMGWCYSLINKY